MYCRGWGGCWGHVRKGLHRDQEGEVQRFWSTLPYWPSNRCLSPDILDCKKPQHQGCEAPMALTAFDDRRPLTKMSPSCPTSGQTL